MQLAQAEGQGIPTILRTMKEEGCPSPIFEIGTENLTCVLPAHPRHSLIKELYSIENDIILGKNHSAIERLQDILKEDPYNFRAIDLFCEVSNLLNKPNKVLNFLNENKIEFEKLNSNTIANIAQAISIVKGDDNLNDVANKLMKYARTMAFEEKQAERIVMSMKKLGQNEELIEFVNESIKKTVPY